MSIASVAKYFSVNPHNLEQQYKHHLSTFDTWDQKEHAKEWLCFPDNIGARLSIDEVAISQGELYTVLTNKDAHGREGALVAMVKGTKATPIANVFKAIPASARERVVEVTMDMSEAMEASVRASFPAARITTDRFHVQQLVSEALQEIRIEQRWNAIKQENEAIKKAKQEKTLYCPVVYENGDTKKQLLARSRFLLFKSSGQWTEDQQERGRVLFREFPLLEKAYRLAMVFRGCYEHSHSREEGKARLQEWYGKVEEMSFDSFRTAAESIKAHEDTILNYFVARSTNASAESFNAKLKGFRALVRGVRDTTFFLFRIATLYA